MEDKPATDASPQTAAKQRAPPAPKTYLGVDNEAKLATLKEEVNVPGTRLGYLARGMDTVLRDAQERLNKDGVALQVKAALGHNIEVPIQASIIVDFAVQVGTGEGATALSYTFPLVPGPHTPPAPQQPKAEGGLQDSTQRTESLGMAQPQGGAKIVVIKDQ